MDKEKFLIVVVGPTAVGKTSVCIELAKSLQTEVVSADSRQFYKEMNLGTAKPTPEEQEGIRHHFIDSHSISEDISAGQYEKMAIRKLSELFQVHDKVILTGGSGLYIDAVVNGMADIPKVNPKLREELNQQLASSGLETLVAKLKTLDSEYYHQVDQNNPQRVIRALEVCLSTGKTYSEFRKPVKKERPFQVIKIGLNRPRQELYERINLRMDEMIAAGLFKEAEVLKEFRHHNALQTVGYKEIFDFLDGKYDEEEAIRLLKRNSRRYAKRQLTWFGKDEEIKWFHPEDKEKIMGFVRSVTN